MKADKISRTSNHACMHAKINAFKILVGKPEGMKPLGSSMHRWMIVLE
jgi:hypothetical protein